MGSMDMSVAKLFTVALLVGMVVVVIAVAVGEESRGAFIVKCVQAGHTPADCEAAFDKGGAP